ncbi:hypothetical protein MSAN_01806400 [Mycena sanguinolenta]|uniref:Uncharacterized protein n=1 Tax=Mycena sanguinolenta TaxID=230812 RepID=A0A8H6XUK3_9AGAR|nr:hypothetical protein MSAN_01806400 [Mycena sanguinolenta]
MTADYIPVKESVIGKHQIARDAEKPTEATQLKPAHKTLSASTSTTVEVEKAVPSLVTYLPHCFKAMSAPSVPEGQVSFGYGRLFFIGGMRYIYPSLPGPMNPRTSKRGDDVVADIYERVAGGSCLANIRNQPMAKEALALLRAGRSGV